MPTLPATVKYSDQYSYSVEPDVVRTEFSTKNTRQRKLSVKRDDIFSIRFDLNNSQLQDWEEFVQDEISNGADLFTAPYYTSDVEYTGSFYLVDGRYSVQSVAYDSWNVSCQFELKWRTLTEEGSIYNVIEEYGDFDTAYNILNALEDMINNNNL